MVMNVVMNLLCCCCKRGESYRVDSGSDDTDSRGDRYTRDGRLIEHHAPVTSVSVKSDSEVVTGKRHQLSDFPSRKTVAVDDSASTGSRSVADFSAVHTLCGQHKNSNLKDVLLSEDITRKVEEGLISVDNIVSAWGYAESAISALSRSKLTENEIFEEQCKQFHGHLQFLEKLNPLRGRLVATDDGMGILDGDAPSQGDTQDMPSSDMATDDSIPDKEPPSQSVKPLKDVAQSALTLAVPDFESQYGDEFIETLLTVVENDAEQLDLILSSDNIEIIVGALSGVLKRGFLPVEDIQTLWQITKSTKAFLLLGDADVYQYIQSSTVLSHGDHTLFVDELGHLFLACNKSASRCKRFLQQMEFTLGSQLASCYQNNCTVIEEALSEKPKLRVDKYLLSLEQADLNRFSYSTSDFSSHFQEWVKQQGSDGEFNERDGRRPLRKRHSMKEPKRERYSSPSNASVPAQPHSFKSVRLTSVNRDRYSMPPGGYPVMTFGGKPEPLPVINEAVRGAKPFKRTAANDGPSRLYRSQVSMRLPELNFPRNSDWYSSLQYNAGQRPENQLQIGSEV